ncbi:hypothetical protein ABIB25_004467 [Nakamurella sp. UYEF19]|uniref:HNH endonuclease n=1 Tax=Nakamurella sp. UYEF19 TaxID=1756392 RepID=UPI00339112D3
MDLPAARHLDLFGSSTTQHRYEVLGDWGYWQARVAQLAAGSPGSELAALLEERPSLADEPTGHGVPTGLGSLRAQLRLDSMAARHRLISSLQGDQYADAAALAVEYPAADEFLSAEVALALGVPESVAGGVVSTGFTLATKLPRTLEALQDGQITAEVAQVMVGATAPVSDPHVAAAIEEIVLPKVAGRSREWVRREVVRQVIRLDPVAADARHEAARKQRAVTKWADIDGMGWMKIHAPIEAIAAAWEALTGLADNAKTPGDERNLDQRRADVFADLFHSVLDRGGWDGSLLPAQHGRKPHVGVLVPYDMIQAAMGGGATSASSGDTDSSNTDSSGNACNGNASNGNACNGNASIGTPAAVPVGDRPGSAPGTASPAWEVSRGVCELVGYGPIAPGQGLRIAAEGDWRRIVCDPLSGTVMDYGRTRYIPPGSLRQFINTRDQTCSFFGCSQPAWRSQIDHAVPYSRGGPTAEPNLCALCLHHHRAKDGGGFSLTLNADRSKTWTTPLGRTVTTPPTSLLEPTGPPGPDAPPGDEPEDRPCPPPPF